MEDVLLWQWIIVIGVSVILFFIAPWSNTPAAFFRATKENQQPNWLLLTSSLVISWIFAKSITNAANLGLSFGFVGGVAYTGYYLSFVVAGVIIYQLRTKGGFTSIHHFLQSRYGRSAVLVFSILIGFRLFNEVWSNTMVIGTYFGEQGSTSYFTSIIVFTLLTLAYSLKGGLSSSLLTDAIQMALFGVLLFIILGVLIPKTEGGLTTYIQSGEWSLGTGVNLLLVALLQSLSYPFHDPVLTDRGFISSPKTTLKAYLWAAPIGALCILLFSFVGIYAQQQGMEGQAAVEVSKTLGVFMMLMMNFIMVTSAASTLDSTFASFSKLAVVDLGTERKITVKRGRLAMVTLTIIGTIPVFLSPEILSGTTVSGTMVIGLAPVFIFWRRAAKPIAFHLSVGLGVVLGIALVMNWLPESWIFFPGKYGDLLSINLIGTLGCFLIFFAAGKRKK
ncbi:MAG: sodium:solute symporter [Saprospiraceae bacterium]